MNDLMIEELTDKIRAMADINYQLAADLKKLTEELPKIFEDKKDGKNYRRATETDWPFTII